MVAIVELGSLLRRNPDFRRLFAATVISLLGDWFTFVAVSGFVAERTGRPGLAALVYAASVLPIYAVFPLTHAVMAAVLCVILAHAGGGAQWALSTYGLQLAAPDEVAAGSSAWTMAWRPSPSGCRRSPPAARRSCSGSTRPPGGWPAWAWSTA
jgi:hypothetical protein